MGIQTLPRAPVRTSDHLCRRPSTVGNQYYYGYTLFPPYFLTWETSSIILDLIQQYLLLKSLTPTDRI